MLSYAFTEEQEEIRAMVRDFAQNEVLPLVEDAERHEKFPVELMPKLGELGLLGIVFPEEYGGIGLDKIAECIFVEEMAKVCAGIAASVAPQALAHALPALASPLTTSVSTNLSGISRFGPSGYPAASNIRW